MSANEYLETVNRLEPEIHPIDTGAYNASAAISLKRIADSLERIADETCGGKDGKSKMTITDILYELATQGERA